MTEKWRSHYWRLSIPFTRARWLLWVLGGSGYFRNIMLLPFPNPAKVNIHNRAKSDRCLPFLFQFSSCLAGLAVYSIIQFSRHKYLLSGPKFRAGRLRDSGDPQLRLWVTGPRNNILSDPGEMVCWPDTRARSAAHAVNINKPGCAVKCGLGDCEF